MKKMLEKVRAKKQNKKGFTLVEVIVVLVILAIMAAILIPSLVGYIDKARQNSIKTDTRTLAQAVQTLASEGYAANKGCTTVKIDADADESTYDSDSSTYTIALSEIKTLSELDDINYVTSVSTSNDFTVVFTGAKITSLTLKEGDKTCTYPDYTVS